MDRNDQQAIDSLFTKLANVERQSAPRDTQSEQFINERITQQPGAPYYMAQTIVVQEQALEAAQRRIEELEMLSASAQPQRGGFFASMFGSSNPPQRAVARPQRYDGAPASPWGGAPNQGYGHAAPMAPRAGGGFLAGAAQTAMGVAGGMLLTNAVMGMMGGNEAQAAEPQEEAPEEEMDMFGDEE